MKRTTITCKTCGRRQEYAKPEGVRGRAPQHCKDHRHAPQTPRTVRWQPIGEPK